MIRPHMGLAPVDKEGIQYCAPCSTIKRMPTPYDPVAEFEYARLVEWNRVDDRCPKCETLYEVDQRIMFARMSRRLEVIEEKLAIDRPRE